MSNKVKSTALVGAMAGSELGPVGIIGGAFIGGIIGYIFD